MADKPQFAFSGHLTCIPRCGCGWEMKRDGEIYMCVNPKCTHAGQRVTAIVQRTVLFYHVAPRGNG